MVTLPSELFALMLTALTALLGLEWRRLRSDQREQRRRWDCAERIVSDQRLEVYELLKATHGDDRTLRLMQRFLSRLRSEVWPEGRLKRKASA